MSLLKLTRTFGAISFLALATAGCGFQPLHGPTASGANLSDVMKSVDIALVPGRVGQRIRNELIFAAQGGAGDGGAKQEYRLELAVKEELRNTLVACSGAPRGQIVELNVDFKLIRIADNRNVFEGKAAGRAAFDKVFGEKDFDCDKGDPQEIRRNLFSDQRAKLDAENRAARTIAETIRIRLSAYLSGHA
jgi:LPS-assembly lipoprotein